MNPPGKGKAAPCTYEILCGLPEENTDTSSTDTCNKASENKKTANRFTGRMDSRDNAKLEDENEADE